MTQTANAAQQEYWNDRAGRTWAEFHVQLDRQIEPLGAAALAALAPAPGETILDVGCGAGQTSVALALRVGPRGAIVGADISAPLLAVARQRPLPAEAAAIQFHRLDAQTADLGRDRFDAAFSRFGVMFFSDPVAAFANIRSALKSSGRLCFVCWRALSDNPWMQEPLAAVSAVLPPAVPPAAPADPLAPGPFAFADPARIRGLLLAAGFAAPRIAPYDAWVGGGDLEGTVNLSQRVGPLGALLRDYPDHRDLITDTVRRVVSPYLTPQGVFMRAGVWIVSAAVN
jgi:ubiquinone/menaquinone biosynthesis C-methylase UbiE